MKTDKPTPRRRVLSGLLHKQMEGETELSRRIKINYMIEAKVDQALRRLIDERPAPCENQEGTPQG